MVLSLAACLIELPGAGADLHLLPAGPFRALDGRPADAPHWELPPARAVALSADIAARKTARVIDYEHQTLHAERNGQPAPAAGWFNRVEWRDDGLHALDVTWTDRARTLIAAGEYRYLSPVFTYHPGTGEIVDLLHAALTNTPALDDLSAIAARFLPLETPPMLPTAVCSALDLADGADEAAALARIAALKTAAPDPAQYVPLAALNAVQDELTTLKTAQATAELDGLIRAALRDGRLLPPLEAWARELGAKDPAALRTYLDQAKPIAALTGMQTQGQAPAPADDPQARFAADAALRAEFGDFETYRAFQAAATSGRATILGSKAQ